MMGWTLRRRERKVILLTGFTLLLYSIWRHWA